MAQLIPSVRTRGIASPPSNFRSQLASALSQRLNNRYVLFDTSQHSVAGHDYRPSHQIDLLVLGPSGKAAAIFIWYGELVNRDNRLWLKLGHNFANVEKQARTVLDHLGATFKELRGDDVNLEIDYLFVTPRKQSADEKLSIDKEHQIHQLADTDAIVATLETKLAGAATDPDNPPWWNNILSFLCHYFHCEASLHYRGKQRDYEYIAGGLPDQLPHMRGNPLRLRVKAKPGSGKTYAALRMFHHALAQDRKPLLITANCRMRDRIKEDHAKSGGVIADWLDLINRFIDDQGYSHPNLTEVLDDPEVWDTFANEIMEYGAPDKWQFDVVIIDDAQSFNFAWWSFLRVLIAPGGDIIWLEDDTQVVEWEKHPEADTFLTYETNDTYRCPTAVTHFINSVLDIPIDSAAPTEGLPVAVIPYSAPEQQANLVQNLVNEATKLGHTLGDIVILSCRPLSQSSFRSEDDFGALAVRYGQGATSSGGALFDSVDNFCGQQAPIIIVVDADPAFENIDEYRRTLYRCATRAACCLMVLAHEDNLLNKRLFDFYGKGELAADSVSDSASLSDTFS